MQITLRCLLHLLMKLHLQWKGDLLITSSNLDSWIEHQLIISREGTLTANKSLISICAIHYIVI